MTGRAAMLSILWLAGSALGGCDRGGDVARSQAKPGTGDARRSADAPRLQDPDAAFVALTDDLARRYFASLPEIATYYGAPSALAGDATSQLTDRSPDGEVRRRREMEALLAELRGADAGALNDAHRRSLNSMIIALDGALAPTRIVSYGSSFGEYGVWFLPYAINQNSGPTVAIVNLMTAQQAVATAAQADAFLTRLAVLGETLRGALAKLQHDVGLGAVPPDFVISGARKVVSEITAASLEENVLYVAFARKLDAAGIDAAAVFKRRAREVLRDEVLPAYRDIATYLERLAPDAPHDPGIWRLPDGEALYAAMIRHMTDDTMSAAEIHALGLAEVERISAQMDALLRQQGYADGTVGARIAALSQEARFLFPNSDAGKKALLTGIDNQLAGVRELLPQWFGTLPQYDVAVRAVPAFSQASAPGGYYDPPALDGSRPGIYWINLRDTALWPSFKVPTLTYHEAIPGHHLQVAISLAESVPLLSSVLFSNPAGEGWALYAEALAAEMGLYDDDPFGDIGRLGEELHRAVRLVVDTGIHALKWSREEAIDYMIATEGLEPSEAVSETERYAVWPAQALGYKLGMFKLQALRGEAEAAYGATFDIREFHDRLLQVASAALPVIEAELRQWIAEAPQ